MSLRRAVITGMGVVTPVGSDVDTFWDALVSGRSGIDRIKQFDASGFSTHIAGEVSGFDAEAFFPKKEIRRMDPFTVFGVAAARMAVQHSGIDFDQEDRDRAGVIVGSGIGGLDILINQMRVLDKKGPGRFSPFMIPQMITNILAGQIAIDHKLYGPNYCLTSACATATHCLGESLRLIQHNEADILLAGGAEGPVNELGIGGFCALRALSSSHNDDPQTASRPFDRDRDGFVCSEGGAVLVVEEYEHARARGADIFCELAGYGRTCDAYHITAPDPEGRGASRAMALAVQDAGLDAADIDYVNAHGTSTELNDKGETLAIKSALGEEHARRVAVSSTKSMTGHLLGAAGGVESVACALAMRHSILPPTINYDTPDPDCDLDYVPNTAREATTRACLNNSLGFGGHNVSLCFKAMS